MTGCDSSEGGSSAVRSPTPSPSGNEPGATAVRYYALALERDERYSVGQEGAVRVRVEPRGGYHMSLEYPTELRLESVAGLALSRERYEREEAASFEDDRAIFRVGVRPTAPGAHRLRALFKFAVCNVTSCLPERRQIEWDVLAE